MKKPNIIMIVSDDHGHWSLGCAGNNEVITPNIDSLAENGFHFENFFCASPVCSPARASLFTGRIPSQHGVLDWIAKGHINEEELSNDLKEKFYSNEKPWQYDWPQNQLKGDKAIDYLEDSTVFTEILAEEGYKCALIGKWHLGNSKNPRGNFSYFKTLAMGGDNYFYPVVLENGEFVLKENTYVTDYITDEALHYLKNVRDKETPFYLSIHYTAPHSPWDRNQHKEEFLSMYDNCKFNSVPFEKPHPWGNLINATEEEHKQYHKTALTGYYAAITAMDNGIGNIISYLKEENLFDNTIILFTGDNGMSMGHHGIYGKGNGTYPLNLYDTAVKVPMVIKPVKDCNSIGKNISNLLSHYDVALTLLDYLNIDTNRLGKNLPGRSFKEILKGNNLEDDNQIVIMDEYGPNRMIRNKEWKYIHRYNGPCELYNILNDPEEKNNLIDNDEFKYKLEELKSSLISWYDKYVIEDKDGKNEDVRGLGQIDFIGRKKTKNESFRK